MKKHDKDKTSAETTPKPQVSTLSWFILVACVFLFRTYAWTTSELWYDEALNLQRFVLPHLYEGNLSRIFTDYPIANNHMLATFMHAAWLSLVGQGFNEFVLRFPDILCALATIGLVMFHWKRHLGGPLSALTGLLLAISPVFTAYAYQLRGYSLTMLLGTMAVAGLLDLQADRRLRGQLLLCLAALLLPLVMPSNLMLAPVIPILGLCLLRERERPWKQAILAQVPWCVATLLGAAYYLTIWEAFKGAMAEPNGWNSALMVALNLLLALLIHTGALLVPALVTAVKLRLPLKTPQHRTLAITLLVMAVTILISFAAAQTGHIPFPRVYLVFLPVATFLAVRWSKPVVEQMIPSTSMLAVALLVMGILTERVSEGITDYQLKQGIIPDNLLQQYYRGSTDLREIAGNRSVDFHKTLVITNAYDEMSMAMYTMLLRNQNGHPPQDTLVLGTNRLSGKEVPPDLNTVAVIAHSKQAALNMLAQLGLTKPKLMEAYKTKSARRRVFMTPAPTRPPVAKNAD